MSTIRTTATLDAAAVEEMDLTISFTMPVKLWRRVLEQQPADYPGWEMKGRIRGALAKVSEASSASYDDPWPPPGTPHP